MQYFLTTKQKDDVGFPAFDIEIQQDASHPVLNPITLVILRESADFNARRLSQMFPKGRVSLSTMARIKAVYENGERVRTRDFNQFYSNLTEEQYKLTQIMCSKTHEYV